MHPRSNLTRPLGTRLRSVLLLALAGLAVGSLNSAALAQRPLGFDISAWQGGQDQASFDQAKAAGRVFAFIRITHVGASNGDPDTQYANYFTYARNAGMLCGPYNFARPDIQSPATDAQHFLDYAAPYITNGYLPPVLDLEAGGGSGVTVVGASNLSAWAVAWCQYVQSHVSVSVTPIIYCNYNYAHNFLNSSVTAYPLWFARPTCTNDPQNNNPDMSWAPWANWTFWQYCTSASVPGISSSMDVDAFNGTMAQLQNMVIGGWHEPPVISNVYSWRIGNSTATINWTTDLPATSQVQYGTTTSYGSSSTLDNTAVTSHSQQLAGLTPNTLYHYRVASSNANGITYSSDYTFNSSGPPSISAVQATNITGSAVTIIWTTNAGSSSQVFYGLTSSYGSQTTLNGSAVTSHSMTLTGLQSATTYHYQVFSGNAYGSSYSADATFTTSFNVPDQVIDNTDPGCTFTNTWSTTSSTSPFIGTNYAWASTVAGSTEETATHKAKWTPNFTVAGLYDVYIHYNIGGNRSPNSYWKVTKAGGTQVYHVNQQANPGYNLLASNVTFNTGTGGYVELMNCTGATGSVVIADAVKFVFKSALDLQAPSAPSGVVATAASAMSMQLSWTAATDNFGVAGYKIYRDGVYVTSATSTSCVDTGLTANTSYSYEISAYDAASNEGARSSPAVARVTLGTSATTATVTCDHPAGGWSGTPTFTFTAVGGFGVGTLTKYKYAWDTSPTHVWTDSEPEWSSGTLAQTATGDGLWYLHLKPYNSEAVGGVASNLGTYGYDTTPPSAPLVQDEGGYTLAFDSLYANWLAEDVQCGIKKYEYRIRTATGAVLVDWTDVGHSPEVFAAGFTLAPRQTYVFDVRATNNVDLVGPVGSSDGIVMFPYDVDSSQAVDDIDMDVFKACAVNGPNVPYPTNIGFNCGLFDVEGDGDMDIDDFAVIQRCYTGTGAIEPSCVN